MEEQENSKLFGVVLNGFMNKSLYNKNRMIVDVFIMNFDIKSSNPLLAPCPSVCCPYTIADGISKQSADNIEQFLKQYGCLIEISESKLTEISKQEEKIQSFFMDKGGVRCPICGSTSVSTGQKGFNIITGFFGSNKTVNRCGKCGYSWEPKQ